MIKNLLLVLLIFVAACSGGKSIIRSEPPTAFVTINGVFKGVTPLEIKLDCEKSKQFDIQVSASGYLNQKQTILCRRFLGPKKDVFFALQTGKESEKTEVPAPQPSKEISGTIRIKSIPSGAEVFLNGKSVGTTPVLDQTIKSGTYTLELRKQGFKPWRENIEINPGLEKEFFPILEKE